MIMMMMMRALALSHGVVYVILGLAIFVELRLVTDRQTSKRQTNRQTDGHTMTAYTARRSIASRGKNVIHTEEQTKQFLK